MLAALIVLILSSYIYIKRKVLETLLRQVLLDVPSSKSYPVIGHYHRFHGLSSEGETCSVFRLVGINPSLISDAFIETNKFSSNFPKLSKLWQFHHVNIFVNSPDLVEKVLTSKNCLQRPLLLLKFFDINEGLLSSRCEWKLTLIKNY